MCRFYCFIIIPDKTKWQNKISMFTEIFLLSFLPQPTIFAPLFSYLFNKESVKLTTKNKKSQMNEMIVIYRQFYSKKTANEVLVFFEASVPTWTLLTAISLEEITESTKHRLVGDELLCRVWSNTRLHIIRFNFAVMRGTISQFVQWLSWNYTIVED